jgi:uncharacterized protein YhaN
LRITRWSIDAFGPFAGHEHTLGPGLTLVYGPNEAGKSSLLRYLLWVLFPAPRAREAQVVQPGRVASGRIDLHLGASILRAERHQQRETLLTDEDGRVLDGGLSGLLHGLQRAQYEHIHAFSAAELVGLDALGDADARERLFAGATAGAGRSVQAAQAKLQQRIDLLWKQRGEQAIRRLSQELDQATTALKVAQQAAAGFSLFDERLAQIAEQIAERRTQANLARIEAARALHLGEAMPVRAQERQHRDHLAGLLSQPRLSTGEADALLGLLARASTLQQSAASARERAQKLDLSATERPVDSRLLAADADIRDVFNDLDRATSDVNRADELSRLIESQRVEIRRHQSILGVTDDFDLRTLDISAAAEAKLQLAKRRVDESSAAASHVQRLQTQLDLAIHHEQAARAAAATIELDPPAHTRAPDVARLRVDTARRARARDAALRAEQTATTREQAAKAARARVVPAVDQFADARLRDDARRLVGEWSALSGAFTDSVRAFEAKAQQAEQTLRQAEAAADVPEPPADDALEGALRDLRNRESEALNQRERAATYKASAERARVSAERILSALPMTWRALSDKPLEVLEAAVTPAREAARSADPGIDPHPSVATSTRPIAAIDDEIAKLNAALVAAEARDAYARMPLSVALMVLALGLLLALIGLGLALLGGGLSWLALVISGVVVFVLGLWLKGRVPARPDSDAFTSTGHLPNVTSAELRDLLRARYEERSRADAETRIAGTEAHAALARAARQRTLERWSEMAVALGVSPNESLEHAEDSLRSLAAAAKLAAAAASDAQIGAESEARWTDFVQAVARLAERYQVEPELSSLRALNDRRRDALRQGQAAQEALERARTQHREVEQQRPEPTKALRSAEERATRAAHAAGVRVPLLEASGWLETLNDAVVAASAAEQASEEARALRAEVEADEAEVTALLLELGAKDLEAAHARVEAAERAYSEFTKRQSEADVAERTRARAQDDLAAARVQWEQLSDAGGPWQSAVSQVGLPSSTSPEVLTTVWSSATLGREIAERLASNDVERASASQRAAQWHSRAAAALRACGRVTGALPADLRAVHEAHLALQSTRQQAEEAVRERQGAADERAAADRDDAARVVVEAELRKRLAASALQTVDEIEPARHRANEVERLQAAIKVDEANLARLLGVDASSAEVLARLDAPDPVAWKAQAESATAHAERLDHEVDQLRRDEGAVRLEYERAQTSADVAECAQRVEALKERLNELAAQLARHVLADHLLSQALSAFKARHAPGVFRVAGEHLARATQGAWNGVRLAADDEDLEVRDASGAWRPSAALSRGTADLLYLTLRLGLARDLRPGGYLLPLLLDDVLVHLDPERADGLAAVLCAEAQTRQVIMFSCRPETLALLQRHAPDIDALELPRWCGAEAPPVLVGSSAARTSSRGQEARTRPSRSDSDQHADVLYEAIQNHPEGLGRSELITLSKIPERAWQSAIQRLLERGVIVQEGVRRGTIYRPHTDLTLASR